MKKTVTTFAFIIVFTAYALYQNVSNSTPVAAATLSPTQSVQTTEPKQTAPVAIAAKPKGLYKDGTYTGVSANAYYGYVQVQVKISGGKIADVAFLDYPQDRGTSREINSYAMPQLSQEAVQVQSAQVNGVSGASDTSAAFKQSLASALTQARA